MIARRPTAGSSIRRAVTLLELLLVLSLLVLLASITWPVMDRPMANHRLRKAADAVQVEWARARIQAIRSGETRTFRYATGSGNYVVQGLAGPEYVAETGAESTWQDTSQPADALSCKQGTLPKKIRFVEGETAYDARAEVLAVDAQELPATESQWSDPIMFYPDGTTSTATLVLRNEYDRTIELRLRGLTGVATVGKVNGSRETVP